MTTKLVKLILVTAIALILVACGSDSDNRHPSDVPSLNTDATRQVEPTTEAVPDDEVKVMAFTQCMRAQGIELMDPEVDSEGNVQRPQLAEGAEVTREEFDAAMEVCGEYLEGLTLGRERQDVSEQLDEFVALATCLREKDHDIDDPTAETLDQWLIDFRVEFNWDDPAAKSAYEECSDTK